MVVVEEPQRVGQLLVLPRNANAHDLLLVHLQLLELDLLDAGRGLDFGSDLEVELAVSGGAVADPAKFGLESEGDEFDVEFVVVVPEGAVELAEAVGAFDGFFAFVEGD